MSIYTELVDAECELHGHESDLYVLDTPNSRGVIDTIILNGGTVPFTTFTGTDGRAWLDIPFAFAPFWER